MMFSDGWRIGIVDEMQRKRFSIAANNPRLAYELLGKRAEAVAPIVIAKPAPPKPVAVPRVKEVYFPPPNDLRKIMALVARHADTTVPVLMGSAQNANLVNARYCVANLAVEFATHLTEAGIERGMNRATGIVWYYKSRHADRLKLYPHYAALYAKCRAELMAAQA